MKKNLIPVILVCMLTANKAFSQWTSGGLNAPIQTNGGNVGIGVSAPATPLDALSSGAQLRLRNSLSIYSDLQTNSSGYFIVTPPTNGRIGLGIASPLTGFHSNMGLFRITDPAVANRGFQITPNYTTPNGEIPAGTTVLGVLSTAGEGLSFASSGGGTAQLIVDHERPHADSLDASLDHGVLLSPTTCSTRRTCAPARRTRRTTSSTAPRSRQRHSGG